MPAGVQQPLVAVTLGADATGRLLARLTARADRMRDMRPLGMAVARVLRASFAANIDAGGRPAFAPLARNTLAAKRLRGQPSRPLVGSGLLRNSLARMNSKGNVTYVTSDGEVRVGTNLPYARYQQEGTRPYTIAPRTKKALAFTTAGGKVVVRRVRHPGIPARPFLLIQPQDWDKIKALVRQWQSEDGLPSLPPGGD